MIKIQKITKYSKYILAAIVTSLVSFTLGGNNDEQPTSLTAMPTSVPVAHADVGSDGSSSDGSSSSADGDCDGGGDCN